MKSKRCTTLPDPATSQQENNGSANRRVSFGHCALCLRRHHLTFHHLIPRKAHRRKAFRKRYTRETLQQGINICRPCHSAIHKFYDELWLARNLSTLDKLRDDPLIARHIKWQSKQNLKVR